MMNPRSAFTRPRSRNVLCSLFFVAASIAVVGEIGSLRTFAQRAVESTFPERHSSGQNNISTATPPPCNGELITPLDEKFDGITPPDLPPFWTAINGIDPDGVLWQTSNSGLPSPPYDTAPNAAWVNDPPVVSDKYLDAPAEAVSSFESSYVRLTFQHNFNLEASELDPDLGFDGGVLEISVDGGNTFQDITTRGSFESGGYTRTIATNRGSPIAGRPAWSGNSGGFITTVVNVAPELLHTVLRWRMASDNTGSSEGWRVDTTNVVWCHFSGTPTPTPTPSATPVLPTLGNISTRGQVLTGDNVMIGGFIVTGSGKKKAIVRAIGPSLAGQGVAGVLADPILELHEPNGTVVTNDNWMDAANKQEIIDTGIPPTDAAESAILMDNLDPGAYTAIVRGVNNTTGVALVEGYDLNSAGTAVLANISTRGFVGTADNVLIGGLIILGGSSQEVLIRGIGPSLAAHGVSGALADPVLELHDKDGNLIISNDNWMDAPNKQAIIDTTIPPTEDAESAILITLAPDAYTAIVSGKNGSTGVALVEAYQLDN